jgi:hypothetical protein
MTSSFKLCTSGDRRCQPENAREAWYCQVHHSAVRLEQIAGVIGISPSSLADAVNPNGDSSLLAAKHHDHVLEVTRDNLAVMAFYAKSRGEVVIKLPIGGEAVDATTAAVVREFGEFLTTHAAAHADRRITAREAIEVEIEGSQAIKAIVTIIEAAKREAETGATS